METTIRHEPGDTIRALENLSAGQTHIYAIDISGWLTELWAWPLQRWMEKAHKEGFYDFTQKKLGPISKDSAISYYEYRAQRRETASPSFQPFYKDQVRT